MTYLPTSTVATVWMWNDALSRLPNRPLFLLCLGTLERHETGDVARAILACCEDSSLSVADALLLPCLEEGSPQQKNTGSSYKLSTLAYSSITRREKVSRRVSTAMLQNVGAIITASSTQPLDLFVCF